MDSAAASADDEPPSDDPGNPGLMGDAESCEVYEDYFPGGSAAWEEAHEWADFNLERVLEQVIAAEGCLKGTMSGGITTTNHFSGAGTYGATLSFVTHAMERAGISPSRQAGH